MNEGIRTYLVGRRNRSAACDIELPESETSVSRRHLELTVTTDGRCYLVHLHPKNTTTVQVGGHWVPLSQDFVDWDAPLLLGNCRTTARELLARLGPAAMAPAAGPHGIPDDPPPPPVAGSGNLEWDVERGTFIRR